MLALVAALALAQTDASTLVNEHSRALDGELGQAIAITAWGGASVIAGTIIAAAKHDDKWWLTHGLMHASVGAINVGFGILGLVQHQNEKRTLAEKLALEGDAVRAYQQELIARHRGSATIYALNFGLDVAYLTAGALLWAIGQRMTKNDVMFGMGVAGVIQGAALFIYDLTSWMLAEQRGTVMARLRFSL
ncbi:MAG: hypothetical protein IT381_21595 [Deltaproteobacteria bacterium]|nr:hypothetical protein [Deltaproteobacteria bacterium]